MAMENEKIKLKLTAAHAKCSVCGAERVLYFTSDYTYGERIVSDKRGKICAYAYLLGENTVEELSQFCEQLLSESGVQVSQYELGQMVSRIYAVTCDQIDGKEIDTTPYNKCPDCLGKMEGVNDRAERIMEKEAFRVTHHSWERLSADGKRAKVKRELIRQGYIALDEEACAQMLSELAVSGRELLEEHIRDYDGILLHVLAMELVNEPLMKLLKCPNRTPQMTERYVKAVETMWKNGNADVVNVVNVTILERLSDEEDVWKVFGTLISEDFKRYINEEVLPNNCMMSGTVPLE